VSFALTRLVRRRSVGDDALETIGALAAAHSESRFQVIHLPEVDEVRAGAYRVEIEEALGARGVDYFPALDECEWSDELFHERDPHPNRQGYEAIARCVGRRLGWPERE
jgi:hypothetical protein